MPVALAIASICVEALKIAFAWLHSCCKPELMIRAKGTTPAGDLLKPSVTPADHRNYALTWFTLSGATSFMALRILRPK